MKQPLAKCSLSIEPHRASRGFLLLVVVGILAVLLTLCVGFLSYTRTEVMSVTSQRDKSDTQDVMHSGIDFALSNICADLMDATGKMKADNPCAFTVVTANPGDAAPLNAGPWWMRPYQNGMCAFLPGNPWGAGATGWGFPLQPATQPGAEAQWTYLQPDFFPAGGVRGRFQVQIIDCNCGINVNDWNEDCNPSQCQMAHMIGDAYGFVQLENARRFRDIGNSGSCNNAPLRYQEAWRVATHTTRYMAWPSWSGNRVRNTATFDWVTGNTSWYGMYGPQYNSISATIMSDGLCMEQTSPCVPYLGSQQFCSVNPAGYPGGYDRSGPTQPGGSLGWGNPQSAGFLPWCMSGFVTQAYTDPDTGRSPINVNTCYNSGETLPFDFWDNPQAYTMEGVWNVESLRRIIKVGWFADPNSPDPANPTWYHAQRDWSILPPAMKMLVEQLKLKLAYQYQETLCRYFTGTYAHNGQGQAYVPLCGANTAIYPAAYPGAPGKQPVYYCKVTDYTTSRFPVKLKDFRAHCHDDFLAMTDQNDQNPKYGLVVAGVDSLASHPVVAPKGRHAIAIFAGDLGPNNTDGCVNFDTKFNCEIAPGKLDMRTACACYDNMCPGKPSASGLDLADFNGFNAYGAGDPLYEMFVLQEGRQEDIDDPYNIDPAAIHGPAPTGSGTQQNPDTIRGSLGGAPPYIGNAPTGTAWSSAYTARNNIYHGWVDNPSLGAITYFAGNLFPDPTQEIDMYDHYGKSLTLFPKGNDICSGSVMNDPTVVGGTKFKVAPLTNVYVPTGPWLDDPSHIKDCTTDNTSSNIIIRGSAEHDVPWRQLSFSPDSFSTELTTTSTTFMLIVNAQLLDAESVAKNPGNPMLHRPQCWNQWGAVIEIAPDVKAELPGTDVYAENLSPAPKPLNPVRAGDPPGNIHFFQWYQNEMPRLDKTDQGTTLMGTAGWNDDSFQDDLCPTLVSKNQGNTSQYYTPRGRTDNQARMPWTSIASWNPGLPGGNADLENSSSTVVRDWKYIAAPGAETSTGCDIHQVPPTGAPRGAGFMYTAPNQTQKRIIYRSVWCLNQGIEASSN